MGYKTGFPLLTLANYSACSDFFLSCQPKRKYSLEEKQFYVPFATFYLGTACLCRLYKFKFSYLCKISVPNKAVKKRKS